MHMTKYTEDLAKMLRALRRACGFSQENVAHALGIRLSTYVYYESGRVIPNAQELLALGRAFDVPPACFLYPERWAGLEQARACPDYAPALEPSRLGELTPSEKELVARSRRGEAPEKTGE